LPPIAIGGKFDTSDNTRVDITDESDAHYKFIKMRKPIMTSGDSFECNVVFGERQLYTFERSQIGQEKLRFWIRRSRNTILWNSRELTKEMGLYSSYCANDNTWNDCIHHASRKCIKISDTQMNILIKWYQFPMEQWWYLNFVSPNSLIWQAKTKVFEEFSFKKEQFNIMLPESYKYWILEDKKNKFPDVFNKDYGGDWQCLAEVSDFSRSITVTGDDNNTDIADVEAKFEVDKNDFIGKIINSDDTFKARLLQCFRGGEIVMKPGEYDYFKVFITMNEKG